MANKGFQSVAMAVQIRKADEGVNPSLHRSSPAAMAMAVQVHEAHQGRYVQGDSLLGGDFVQRVVDMRQVTCRDVSDESAHNFVIAHAAVQPAEKQDELHADGKDRGEYAVPVCGHENSL